MAGIKHSLLVYDIWCQWFKNFQAWVEGSPYLSIPEGMMIQGERGDFHIKGHVEECFARFALTFIVSTGVIDGEMLETLRSVLNKTTFQSAKGATLAHQNKILDDHMNHSNWKKLIGMGELTPTLGVFFL
ncbi:hypothetical protein L208DRAFT_1302405 [Tricholoma matsutake]|nr:hypothetical protein L208DRAFT_1302405 [Tricholoma matsutake 945]